MATYRIALEGVREEEKVGPRTTLDVLNAELEYLDSQTSSSPPSGIALRPLAPR